MSEVEDRARLVRCVESVGRSVEHAGDHLADRFGVSLDGRVSHVATGDSASWAGGADRFIAFSLLKVGWRDCDA
jgi:hypothetical protein